MSYTKIPPSNVPIAILFIRISFRSNSMEQTPFLLFVSHRRAIFLRSNSLISPLSYPAQTARSTLFELSPKETLQQSLDFMMGVDADEDSGFLATMLATGSSFWRGSHTFTLPSLLPVTISGAPQSTENTKREESQVNL